MGIYPGGVNIYEAQANPPANVNRCCDTCDRMFMPWGSNCWKCEYRNRIAEPMMDVCEHWLWKPPQ